MSLDKSLKRKGGITRMRNVLTRAERIQQLMREERWHEGMSPFGLPKVRVVRLKKSKRSAREEKAAQAAGGASAGGENK
ncbi:MAG: small basic protein [Gemmatales bacterium]|nr:small basic protein [Gemmatales bacterium]MDW7995741.1 small basic protein [Gemmatales bacterium]